MSGVSKRKFLYFKLYINNLSNFHFYNDLSQLGLSEGASINNLLAKMPAPSVGVFYCLSKSITGLPFDTQCMVTIFKNGSPFRIEVQDIWSGRTYVAIYSGGTVGKFVEYALKSDLFAYNWITNPNTCTTPFAVVNGWSPDFANAPDDARNTWNSLQTTWVYPSEIGDLSKQRLQTLITGNNTLHTRMYANGNFSNWS